MIEYIAGTASLKSPTEVEVVGTKGKKKTMIQSDNVIIATGARNREVPGLETDGKRVISSKEAMVLDDIPKSMIIIGAGAIGAEFASFYSEYGTKIHLVEMLPEGKQSKELQEEISFLNDMISQYFVGVS